MSTKRKAPGKLAPPTVRSGARIPTKSAIDESRTTVANTDVLPATQTETVEISSDSDSDEDLSDEEQQSDADESQINGDSHVNGNRTGQSEQHGEVEDESDGEEGAPSFGELLRSNDAIDVPALLQNLSPNSGAIARPTRKTITVPHHNSLTTVLSQALRTDDTDLLESCLHTTDATTVRNTIENIDSMLAGTLLEKLAARLYRRPGRASSLMTWVQWTLIAHGGVLASQPKVIQSLSGLQKVLSERARGLSSLLALKGKLDLLESQMKLRKKMQQQILPGQGSADEHEGDVVWVEGEDREDGVTTSRRDQLADDDDDEPVVNGVMGDSSDEEDLDEEEDDEESEDGEESLDEDEVDHDDVDESMGEEEDSDVEAAPPSKVQKVAKSFSKRK
ncbi:U3 small nucleolar RNA-associated protein-like protein [Hapsidospora chrysogenum ATCC 11550]|uniref:U3 small nucleolar RNA-associated protein-like protein n=1 Tax=Hapsidospora chrysogenum (strain ATCC 11550 / CBS 779.69 / DSM 880 / IAM 14645 / JCM 23072 / IMI 49137) TaxID=857340 RepID=A0A086SXA6_HAPC1|nr:U3 small nucleolar RNA-associated protein-like protein [Hapsidospora chrysogenum ATCC 11550]